MTVPNCDFEALPLFDKGFEAEFFDQYWVRYIHMRAEEQERLLAAWRETYARYRETPEWQQRREWVFKRAKNRCEECRDAPTEELHHLHYRTIGDEGLEDLQGVCGECHDLLHERRRQKAERDLLNILGASRNFVADEKPYIF